MVTEKRNEIIQRPIALDKSISFYNHGNNKSYNQDAIMNVTPVLATNIGECRARRDQCLDFNRDKASR